MMSLKTCGALRPGAFRTARPVAAQSQAPCTCSTASQHTPDEELKGDSDAAWQVPAATAGLLAAWPSAAAAEGLGSQAGTGSSTDPVIAVLFTLAVLALGVVTVGMGYLSLQQWQNGTQDNKDRVNAEAEERRREMMPKASGKSGKKLTRVTKAKSGKGFGPASAPKDKVKEF